MFVPILSAMIFCSFFGILFIIIIPSKKQLLIKKVAYVSSICTFLFSLFLLVFFDSSCCKFQFVEWVEIITFFNFNFFVGVDGISVFFIILTTFLTPVCLLIEWSS